MSALFASPLISTAPAGYKTPPFPSLYLTNLFSTTRGVYLYHTSDIWRFTLYWTLILLGAAHLIVAGYACFVHGLSLMYRRRNRKARAKNGKKERRGTSSTSKIEMYSVLVPATVIVLWGVGQAVIAGSLTGSLLGAVYEGGGFRMNTWIPVVAAGICTLVLVLGSFSVQGGM